ncbi:ATP-binding protein [Streptomyces sp. NPDC021218]|uniref:ATP-binding protein n=1 Tax=Streptomyces sp. NPDC021218 TaxID=3365119 RepID=UPI0037A70ABB
MASHRADSSGYASKRPRKRYASKYATPAPTAQSPHTDSENGRGLLLVGELADAWGDIEHTVGKTVWFTVKATRAQGRAQ